MKQYEKDMDKLSESDAKLFHKLMDSLLFFANKKLNIIKNCASMNELHKNDIEKIEERLFQIFKCRTKYHVSTIADLFSELEKFKYEFDELDRIEDYSKILLQEYKEAENRLFILAKNMQKI